jgi:hypothetical protein
MFGMFRARRATKSHAAPAVPFTDMPPEALDAAKSGIRAQLKRLNNTIDENEVSIKKFGTAEDEAYAQARRYNAMKRESYDENERLIPQRDALAATLAGLGG